VGWYLHYFLRLPVTFLRCVQRNDVRGCAVVGFPLGWWNLTSHATFLNFRVFHKWTSRRNTRIAYSCRQYFHVDFQTAYRNDAYNISLDSYSNFASLSCSLFFEILYCLKIILNIQNNIFADFSNSVQFLRSNFQKVHRIDAYDMPLESCWLGATFSYRSFSPILYSLRADLKKKHDSTFRNTRITYLCGQ
jgi:hypothetical protein